MNTEKYLGFENINLSKLHPESNPRYMNGLLGLSTLFADYYSRYARFVPERNSWYVYTGIVWEPDLADVRISQMAKAFVDELQEYALTMPDISNRAELNSKARSLFNPAARIALIKDAKSVHPLSISCFDSDPMLFNCRNGTLDLTFMQFRSHSPEDFLTKISGVEFNPEAKYERWEQFIDEITCSNKQLAYYLQRCLGYGLFGGNPAECLFLIYGPSSRNGKSTLMETYLKIMKDYGCASSPDALFAKRSGSSGAPSEEIARLAGIRFVNVPEPPRKCRFQASLIKKLTGNDTITARFLNENSFDFKPQFKIYINTNYLPEISDLTLFNSGRIKLIPFLRHFEDNEQDKDLKTKFFQPKNLSAIFNWLLQGYKDYLEVGLGGAPDVCDGLLNEYREDSDRISQFISENLLVEEDAEVSSHAVYEFYSKWCADNGFLRENRTNFSLSMKQHFKYVKKRTNGKGNPTGTYCGCRINPYNFK